MPSKRRPQARRARLPRAKTATSTSINISRRRSEGKGRLTTSLLGVRSTSARDRSLHVAAAMRNDPNLSFTSACELEHVKPETAKKYLGSTLYKSKGLLKIKTSDRIAATLYVPDAHGNAVAVHTHSSKDRKALSRYLRDLGRYLRGDRNALAAWHGRRIAGVDLITAGRTIIAMEPALSDFSLYRALNGGAA